MVIKKCKDCGELKQHCAKGFCYNCYMRSKKYYKTYYKKHKEEWKIYMREWSRKNRAPEQMKESSRKAREKDPQYVRDANKKSYYKFKDKFKQRREDKKKNIPKTKCELCGSTENLQTHHVTYIEPIIIKILCRSCHYKIHRL